uniref:Uncharacterized protein n=1 Tax=Setaria viridis TaxID=4556 RepID=A0A4U6TAX4_SETVI|nr:hypothetical protein SEVIR_9G278232v2 [Setaria viridis]
MRVDGPALAALTTTPTPPDWETGGMARKPRTAEARQRLTRQGREAQRGLAAAAAGSREHTHGCPSRPEAIRFRGGNWKRRSPMQIFVHTMFIWFVPLLQIFDTSGSANPCAGLKNGFIQQDLDSENISFTKQTVRTSSCRPVSYQMLQSI